VVDSGERRSRDRNVENRVKCAKRLRLMVDHGCIFDSDDREDSKIGTNAGEQRLPGRYLEVEMLQDGQSSSRGEHA